MTTASEQFSNLLWTIIIGQLIIVIVMAWFIVKYIIKKKRDEPTEKEIRKVIDKEEQE